MVGKSADSPARLLSRLLTEFVGTFIFLSVIALSGPLGVLAPLAIGSVLMVMVYLGGHVSGGHYNPAVSFGVFLRGQMDALTMALYWVAQLVGAVCAFLFGHAVSGRVTGIAPAPTASTAQALAVEGVFTLALVLVVLNVAATTTTKGNSYYGLAIGFTIVAAAFVGGPISGGAFNPAVGFGATFGASVFGSGGWSHLWLYVIAPLVGAALAAGIHWVQIRGSDEQVANTVQRERSVG